MKRMLRRAVRVATASVCSALPRSLSEALAEGLIDQDPNIILETLGPRLNRVPDLGNMPFDLPVDGELRFEHLSGLFASTSLNHGVIGMTIRQTAYLYGFTRQRRVRRAIEIGRYKGGSSLT